MSSEEKARTFNMDGYYNMLNKYGTRQDNQTAYDYLSDPFVDDMTLVKMYEGNGLFSTVIDRPAEEATKHGYDIDFGKEEISDYIYERMDDIGFEEQFTTAIKWARLYGGAIGVLIVNDGKGLEEPLDVNSVTSIEEIRVFERSLVQPDYQTMYSPANGIRPNTVYREPEFFDVFSIYGTFKVHRSRCLVFRNGRLPEQATNENYRYWGIPEYIRVREAIRECVTSHRYGVQLLEKSSQAVYSMKNLANYLSTDAGENQIIKRLQIIDMARSMMNTIAIDADGEMYDFKTMTMAGAKDLIDTTCNMLSAVTHIPQTILFGRSPAGENATGESDMENYYNMVENIQKQNMKRNSRLVIDLIIKQGIHDGDIEKAPKYKVSFAKLWSMSDSEQASVEQTKAQTELTKAQAVQIYSDLQAVDPTEIRDSISDNEDLGISVDKSADSHKKNLESIDIDPDDLDLGIAIDIQDEPKEKDESFDDQNSEKDSHQAEDQEIAEGIDHEESIKPTDSEMVIGEETEGAPDTVPSESETVIAKEMNNDAAEGDWITINGTHVLIGKGGKAESGGNLVGKDFSSAKSEKHEAKGKSGGGNKAAKTEPAKTSKESPSSKSITTKRDYSGVPSDIAEAANKGEFMVYGGDAEKVREERKQKIIDSGLKYTTNEEYGSVVVNDPRLSFEENSNLSKIANNGWSDLNVDDYRKACKEAGVEPDLHYTAKEYPQQSLKKADGTPVYWNLRPNMVMSAEQIYQHDESAQKILDNSHKVTEQMTDAQRASVTNYTGQYSDRGYLAVNGYLSGENPNASAQTKESAKHLTEALDHELGADTTVFRGEDDMSHISSNPKASKILKQISRGDFSHAAELKEILEGSEVENSTVVSTSPYYNSNYGMRDIQMVMKVPGSAKAVNITELSKYGGSKDKFSQMFGSFMNQESEIAFKPGMKYKITDVEYGLDTTEKKPKGKVFLTCEVIPEGKDNPEPRKKANGSNSAAKSNNTQLVKHETSASESKSVSLQKPYSTPNGNKDSRTDADTDNGVGIIVVKDGKFLVGTRQDGFGICSAGGHIKDGETPQEAAKREAYEEFGIVPLTLIPIGETKASSGLYCNSTVFLCDSYSGKIETDEEEMTSPRFMTMDELSGVRLYEPFEESLALMLDVLFRESKRTDTSDADWITVNGVHIPIGKNGKAIGGPLKGKDFSDSKSKSGEESESSNSLTTNSKTAKIKNVIKTPIDQISPTGKNILKHRGFKSEQHLNNHWQNGRTHRAEYEAEGLDKSGYEKRAVELAESKADGVKIRGYRTRDGYICRYDVEKNDYVKADIDKGIRTMFKPDNGVQYYEDLKHAEGGDDNGN